MKPLSYLVVALILAAVLACPAHAHAPLIASNPADGAVLAGDEAPAELKLQFRGTLRLTSAAIETSRGERVTLETSARSPAETHRVQLPDLAPGDYTVRWRGVAADGHVMSGTISFTVTDS